MMGDPRILIVSRGHGWFGHGAGGDVDPDATVGGIWCGDAIRTPSGGGGDVMGVRRLPGFRDDDRDIVAPATDAPDIYRRRAGCTGSVVWSGPGPDAVADGWELDVCFDAGFIVEGVAETRLCHVHGDVAGHAAPSGDERAVVVDWSAAKARRWRRVGRSG